MKLRQDDVATRQRAQLHVQFVKTLCELCIQPLFVYFTVLGCGQVYDMSAHGRSAALSISTCMSVHNASSG